VRLVTFTGSDGPAVGVRCGDGLAPVPYTDMLELIGAGDAGLERAAAAARAGARGTGGRLLAPVPAPPKMLFCGVNYPDHVEENPAAVLPTEPFFFAKLPSAVVGPGAPIVLPSPATQGDYEVELAAVIGRRARAVPAERALEHVFGYTVVNDVSARDVQFRDAQITLGKNADSFCPMGPEIVTADEIPDPAALVVETRVNGELRQRGSTGDWIFHLAELIEFLTRARGITLEPGDLVTTGTPAGVAAFRDPPPWLAPGDVVTVAVDAIGQLENPVTAGWER